MRSSLSSEYGSTSLAEFTKLAWQQGDVLIFVGALGIAVRAIAKYVGQKDTDPAVLVVDEQARFVIPVLFMRLYTVLLVLGSELLTHIVNYA